MTKAPPLGRAFVGFDGGQRRNRRYQPEDVEPPGTDEPLIPDQDPLPELCEPDPLDQEPELPDGELER